MIVEGSEIITWPRGSIERRQHVSFWIKAWQALGGQAANSSGALKYLLKQVEELASNRDQQPVYIQWTATADSTALLNASELHDGWYVIENFEPDYGRNVVMGIVECRMTVVQVAPQAPRIMAISSMGGSLSTDFSGGALNLITAPIGATILDPLGGLSAAADRTGAEGVLPSIESPPGQPEVFLPSTTIANYFKGDVRVYDTINTTNNPVPTSGGTYVNANWVQVQFTDHDFTGDCVLTNGLQLLIFQATTSQICTCYVWNTALATANWQQYAKFTFDANQATLKSYTLNRVGPDECAITAVATGGASYLTAYTLRLQRGRYDVRVTLKPLGASMSGGDTNLELLLPAAPKILFNHGSAGDFGFENPSVNPTDYGYAGAFINSSTYPFVTGFLYQYQATTNQITKSSGTSIYLGDRRLVSINGQQTYGFFAIPYGVNASYSTADLQAEAEGGTLGTGWTSQANGSASAGNEAKCVSGTAGASADTFGTTFSPTQGDYDVWFRVKVTSTAASSAEMTLGIWDPTAVAFVASTTFNRNAMSTSYAWYRAFQGLTLPAAHATRFRAVTALPLTTDWFIDEAALVPRNATGTSPRNFPRSVYQHFAYDRSTRIVRV